MWEGQALPHDTKFGNCRDQIVDSRAFPSWSLIHGSSWSGLLKVEPGVLCNIGYPSKIYLKLKSHEILFIQNISQLSNFFFIFCTEHGSDNAVLCAKFQGDWIIDTDIVDE